MTLYMQNEEYLTGATQGYGARVTIHEHGSLPYPATDGIFIPTAFETSIALKRVNICNTPLNIM